jgi:hypothetical protein
MKHDKTSYTHAEIYFMPWNTLTRVRQSVDDIRRDNSVYLYIDNINIKKILDSIDLIKFVKYDGIGGDARFVIDFYKSDKTVITYYSDGKFLYSQKLKCYGGITSEFFEAINVFKKS